MASKKRHLKRVVAYLDPAEYTALKALLPPRQLDFSKWVRRKAKEELAKAAVKVL